MRWLIVKDLQILRRSPFLIGLLVLYPIVLAVLIGAALSAGPGKPKVAFANLVSSQDNAFTVGGERLDASRYARELFHSIDPIRVRTRAEAVAKVRSGEALGALIVPADVTRRLQDTVNLSGGPPPTLEVIYNAEDPVKRRYVESTIRARLAEANQALSGRLTTLAAEYIRIIVGGGSFSLFGKRFNVLGLKHSEQVLAGAVATLPPGAATRTALEQVRHFARLAADNLDVSQPILASIGAPVQVRQTVLRGSRTPLSAFAVAVSVTVSLMFVTLGLASGMLALEREEHAYGRLVRGLVSRGALVIEKIALAALCSAAVTLVMLAALGAFVHLHWGRAPLWIAALALGAGAFAGMGVAIGALAREVRAASLLALLVGLPVAFLALVPAGSVAPGLYDLINGVSALFPFKPSLRALDGALNGGAVLVPALHLAALAAGFAAVARLALRRFD